MRRGGRNFEYLRKHLTAADLAELDVLVWALVTGVEEHRPKCGACVRGDPCPSVSRAIREVLDWRSARLLLTQAERLREHRRREHERRTA